MKINELSEAERNALPKDGGPHYNRLIFENRLYLRSHAHHKIQWYPWGQAAFDLAAITQKPLFLSIGYSSCHWCHEMAKQTFENDDVAQRLNAHFIAIKIDRDEYPDIDQIYMAATQLLTSQGGWPNSVFCLPTGQPFYAGTFFPPYDATNRPGFITILDHLAEAYATRQDDIKQQAQEIERVIIKMNRLTKDPYLTIHLNDRFEDCLKCLKSTFDPTHGGFGGAPKFPPFSALRLLLKTADNTMAIQTLTAMALSGLYDHVDGGFHRYSTDAEWHLPHFEKILMDNAQMIELYALAYIQVPTPLFERIVRETIQHLMDHWALPQGGFACSMDADSEGAEGHYYVMSMDELNGIPGSHPGWADYFQFTPEGNMRDEATGAPTGTNIFHPIHDNPTFDWSEFRGHIQQFRHTHRTLPLIDTAYDIASNAWLCHAMALAADIFNEPAWKTLAITGLKKAMTAIDNKKHKVYADDISYTLMGQLALGQWDNAISLWHEFIPQFYDGGEGGMWYTQDHHKTPMSRIKDIYDHAKPSPNGLLIDIALQIYTTTKDITYATTATTTIQSFLSSATATGCETYWLGVYSYWQQHKKNPYFDIQFMQCTRLSDNVIGIQIDVAIGSGYRIYSEEFAIKPVNYKWLEFKMDPISACRMPWSNTVINSTTGSARIQGRVQLASIPKRIIIEIPVCGLDRCHDPVQVTLPIA
jgi:uncharacterized protein YyaL (SSP411 family)